MRVLIVRGYDVFGGRLARLLLRDGVNVIVAGRDLQKAREFTNRFGGDALKVDVAGDLAPLAKSGAKVIGTRPGYFPGGARACHCALVARHAWLPSQLAPLKTP
jgi:NAD(P)-dependent dehydrogenase (short-subunit alcohol dehydrogenase family)